MATVEPLESRRLLSGAVHDVLFVGDGQDNSIKRFDAQTGAFLGNLVAPNGGRLDGPRGMIFRNPGELLVINQNASSATLPGEILDYNAHTGALIRAIVPATDPNAPGDPASMVLKGNVLYVAVTQTAPTATANGAIEKYDVNTGEYLGSLFPQGFSGQLNPLGVVFGPDGKLYFTAIDGSDRNRGYVLRMDPDTGAWNIIAQNKDDNGQTPGEITDMHHVGGLAFSPGGQLYVADHGPAGFNKIFGFNVATGALVNEISVDQPGGPAVVEGPGIVFGPGGKLFTPIYTSGPEQGAVREYDVKTDTYTDFVPPGGVGTVGPESDQYLIFGRTDSATLAYNTRRDHDGGDDNSDARSDQGDDSDSSDGDSLFNRGNGNSADDIVTAVLGQGNGHAFAQ